ncbi:hypothetical protein HNY73_017916 [Argiope bruennichi]|uniref:Uncharacterized protein n=1 Tax=Argiope bruennichi TaxID=94029 RepID=A0A8T0EBJ4_ARGBR|nr:hypothetical protein HNY73_017916 [Argiope bruennichi]
MAEAPLTEVYNMFPFPRIPRRPRTGTTPPPPISPLGSPPYYTPIPERVYSHEIEWSPQKYHVDVPKFNVREVLTPPRVVGSPFYGHSTPGPRIGLWDVSWGHRSPNRERYQRHRAREEEKAKLPPLMGSPITDRRDVDSLFEGPLVPWVTPETPPPRIPLYYKIETPARSPAVELMREEMRKGSDSNKYRQWYTQHCGQAAMRDLVLEQIETALEGRIEHVDFRKLHAHDAIAMLSEYLRKITERLINQNLELPPLANSPVFNIIEQKKISIARENQLKELAQWDIATRMERIVAQKGLCIPRCPYQETMKEYKKKNEVLEQEIDAIRQRILEMDTECMKAMADMSQYVDVVSPNFLNNLSNFLRTIYGTGLPDEVYEAAAKDISTHLRRIFLKKRSEWMDVNREVNELYPLIKDQTEELARIKKEIQACEEENTKLRAEFSKYRTNSRLLEWLLKVGKQMLNFREQGYASTYQSLMRAKRKTVEFETQLGLSPSGRPEITAGRTPSPVITSPPSPTSVGSLPEGTIGTPVYASSPGFRFSPSQLETSMSPDLLGRMSPPPEMLNISDLSGGGRSPTPEQTLHSPAGADFFIGDMSAPSEMINISDLSGSGSPLDSLEGSASSFRKTVAIPTPGKADKLKIDVEIMPQEIRRSPSGQRVVCDLAVALQEAAAKPRESNKGISSLEEHLPSHKRLAEELIGGMECSLLARSSGEDTSV